MPRAPRDPAVIWKIEGRRVGFIRGGVFTIDRRVHGRRRTVSTGCLDEAAANVEYRRWELDPAHYLARSREGATWAEVTPRFIKAQRLEAHNTEYWTTQQARHLTYMAEYRRDGRPVFLTLDSFDASDIRAYLAARAEGLAGAAKRRGKTGLATRNRELSTLKALMGWARQERLTMNRADEEVKVVREGKGKNPPREVRPREWGAVLPRLMLRWRCAAEVLLGAGLRYGELAALRAPDIHQGGIYVPQSKSGDSRLVPCSARTVRSARRLVKLGGVPNDLGSQMAHRLGVQCRALKITPFSAHELRHTFATGCLRNGVDLETLRVWMGHKDIRTTQRYLHLVQATTRRKTAVAPL